LSAVPLQAIGDSPAPADLLESLDCLRVAIAVFDSSGRLIYANRHLGYLFPSLPPALNGLAYRELLCLSLPDLAPSLLDQGIETFLDAQAILMQEPGWVPQDLSLKNGRIIELKARRDRSGRTALLWTDVTEARQQAKRLEETIALSADAFAFYDSADRFVTGNEAYAKLVNMKLDALKGMEFEAIITQAAMSGLLALDVPAREWVARRLRGHRGLSSADTLQTASGAAYLVRDRAVDHGRVVAFIDITEKTRAENALAETQAALETSRDDARRQTGYLADLTRRLDFATAQANNAKNTLLRTMSHELKTPLNAILGFSDLMMALSDNLPPTQIREYAGLIHQGGHQLLKMLNQIMDLTKISAGRYELRKGAVNIEALLWELRQNFLPVADARQIALEVEPCAAGLVVHADEMVLTAMMNALVENAITFIQAGGRITLSATGAKGEVRLAVADNGPGVSDADLVRILQPFEHAGTVAEHPKGAGLGLTLVKALAELHGGSFRVESISGEGFTAAILLPDQS
jgi:signal transduction histidine kinase